MKSTTIYIVSILTTILFVSCESEIEFKGDECSPKIVINSLCEEGNPFVAEVSLSRPTAGYDTDSEILYDAEVILYVDGIETEKLDFLQLVYENDTIVERRNQPLVKNNNWYYNINSPYEYHDFLGNPAFTSKTKVELGKSYKLVVSHSGQETVTCETTVPEPVKITNLEISKINQDGEYKVNVHFDDVANVENYYYLRSFNKGRYISHIYFDPEISETDSVIYSDVIFKNSLNFECYNPVFQQNDANESLFSDYITHYVFSDEIFDGKNYGLSFDVYVSIPFDESDRGSYTYIDVEILSISKEMYLYLKSINSYNNNSDLEIMTEPVIIYNNIENGMGIFGSYSSSEDSIIVSGEYFTDGYIYLNKDPYKYY